MNSLVEQRDVTMMFFKKKHTPAQFVQLYVILQGTVLFPGMKAVHVSSRQLICQFINFFGSNRRLLRFYILHRYLSFYNELACAFVTHTNDD